jgi:MYXO-CTERM domain-containing protein
MPSRPFRIAWAQVAAVSCVLAAQPLAAQPADPAAAFDAQLARERAAEARRFEQEVDAAEKLAARRLATLPPADTSYQDALTGASFALTRLPPQKRAEAVARFVRILEGRLSGARLADGLTRLGETLLTDALYDLAEPLLARAEALYREPESSASALEQVRTDLVDLHAANGDAAAAAAVQARIFEAHEAHDAVLLHYGTEAMRRDQLRRGAQDLELAVSLHVRRFPRSPEAARVALGAVLSRKGRALDVTAAALAAARTEPEAHAALERIAAIDARLAVLLTRGGESTPEVTALREERTRREVQLNAMVRRGIGAERVTVAQVASGLPADAALVEIVEHRAYTFAHRIVAAPAGDGRPELAGTEVGSWGPRRYSAYVLRPNGEIAAADLGDAAAIDKAARAFLAAVRDPKSDPKPPARALDALVMAKVRAILGGVRRLFVSPDGALSLVPFGALVDEDGRYAIERATITYLTSGRELVHDRRPPAPEGRVVVFADPDFGPTRAAGSGRGVVDFSLLQFPPLAGTRQEAERIAQTVQRVDLVTGPDATEARLRATRRPLVLHLATHGFFVPADDGKPRRSGGSLRPEDPMLRAALALSGANRPARDADDGVLTALEASTLDLDGTALVVLSACSTAIGEASVGEGVYGLRRAFSLAGAESLVMSLWDVSDAATRDLMTGYYARLARGEGRSEALRSAELAMLADPVLGHPFFWASFVASGSDDPVRLALAAEAPAPPSPPPVKPPARGCACEAGGGGPEAAPLPALALLALLRRRSRRAR